MPAGACFSSEKCLPLPPERPGGHQGDRQEVTELSHDVFSTFVGTSHAVSYFLRRFLEGDLSESVSKVYLLDGAVMKKSKKHHAGAPHDRFFKDRFERNHRLGIHPRIKRIPALWCHQVRPGAYLPHAPGVRMTVVQQTPSKYRAQHMLIGVMGAFSNVLLFLCCLC